MLAEDGRVVAVVDGTGGEVGATEELISISVEEEEEEIEEEEEGESDLDDEKNN